MLDSWQKGHISVQCNLYSVLSVKPCIKSVSHTLHKSWFHKYFEHTYIIYVFYIGKRYVYYTGEGSIAIRWSFDTIDKLGTFYTHLIVIHVYRSKCFDHISHTQSVWFDIVHLICDFERCSLIHWRNFAAALWMFSVSGSSEMMSMRCCRSFQCSLKQKDHQRWE